MSTNPKLSKLIAGGRRRYVLDYGVLAWGLGTAAMFTALTAYSKGSVTPTEAILAVTMFPLAGVAWGGLMWSFLKRMHNAA